MDIEGYPVEKLSGQTLPDFMRDHIFEPLGMKDTGLFLVLLWADSKFGSCAPGPSACSR
jgi:CubicO group peptidase (beta-lactamase class C family)